MKTIQVPKEQLGAKMNARMVDMDYKGNTVVAYAWGCIPVRIATDMSQKEFDKLLNYNLWEGLAK